MSASSGPSILTNGLVFDYDMSNTKKSFIGPPATNRIISIPLTLTVYAYATGPVSTTNIIDATYQPRTVSRYTISNNINTARAMVTSSGLTTGVSYTFSCKIKYNGTNVSTPSFAVDASKGNPEGGANNNTVSSSVGATTSLGNGWYYVTYTWSYSACPTSGCYLTYGVVTGADATYVGNTFDVYEPQFEIGSFATPYVTQSNGIRSNTQAIIDLTNNNTITATSLTYASDNTFSFNGSSNYISVSYSSILNTPGGATYSIWLYPTGGNGEFLSRGTSDSGATPDNPRFYIDTSAKTVYFDWSTPGSDKYVTTSANSYPSNNTWINVVGTATPSGRLDVYVNGTVCTYGTRSAGADTMPSPLPNTTDPIQIGGATWIPRYFTGKIANVSLYDRTLSASEIQQNFNALRTRYGI